VGFRFFVQRCADELGVKGYVRNRGDGSVEVMVEAEREKLDRLLSQLRIGPRAALVERVDHQWLAFSSRFSAFEVRY
jgi:acylphosphatase